MARVDKARSWSARLKQLANALTQRVVGASFFRISIYEIFGDPPNWQKRIEHTWTVFIRETNFPAALGLLVLCSAITYCWWRIAPSSPFLPSMAEVTLDVFFILIIFASFEYRRKRFEDIERQRETIDDYKRWEGAEGQLRLAGAIRRLNRKEVFALDLSGVRLNKFSFALNGISSIRGSTFFDGSWGERFRDATVRLIKVSFDYLDCKEVIFSAFNPFEGIGPDMGRGAKLTNCSFWSSNLQHCRFNGAELVWTEIPPVSQYEEFDDEETGEPQYVQVSYGPFYLADLAGASFQNCRFKNVDFRDAENVEEADFSGAEGLETAYFDGEPLKQRVLARIKPPRR